MEEAGVDRKPSSVTEIASDDARSQFADLLNRAGFGGERFLITRHGKPLVGVVSVDDVRRLTDQAA